MARQGQRGDQPDADDAGRSRFALPPACPRCELTKSQVGRAHQLIHKHPEGKHDSMCRKQAPRLPLQMNRTIQNYQKAYRKKVEGLKTELNSVRADNQHLKKQVKSLRRKRLTHLPSLLIGAGLSFLINKVVQQVLQHQRASKNATADEPEAEAKTAGAVADAAPSPDAAADASVQS